MVDKDRIRGSAEQAKGKVKEVVGKVTGQACNDEVFLYGFDLLELNGEDYRGQPLEKRKAKLERLLTGSTGVRFSEHLEGDGPIIFQHACKMGLEGIVSKRRDLPYRSGRVNKLDQGAKSGEPRSVADR